jgi:hypothetical protein
MKIQKRKKVLRTKEAEQALIDCVEFAIDYGMQISEAEYELYNTLIKKRKDEEYVYQRKSIEEINERSV